MFLLVDFEERSRIPQIYAILISIALTIIYVGVLYIGHNTRPRPGLPRDSPYVIQARIRAVTFATLLCVLLSFVILYARVRSIWITANLLGLWPISLSTITDTLRSLILISSLFTAPLVERFFFTIHTWSELKNSLYSNYSTWVGWRNYIVAPFTEEVVFRACISSLHILTGISPTDIVFVCPLYFGIAHVHHAYEFHRNYPRSIVVTGTRCLIQFCYTTIFGWLATFLFIRLGSVWPTIVVHAFCNFMGLPRLYINNASYLANALYISLLMGGAWGFYKLIWGFTKSENALMAFL